MSIRAVSNAGLGIPIYIDLRKQNTIFDFPDFTTDDSILGIGLGILLSIFCIIVCIWIFVKNRTCSKNNTNHASGNNQALPSGHVGTNCTSDVHEMQTLITRSEISTVIPNGNVHHYTRPDVTEVSDICTHNSNVTMSKLFKTSPKFDSKHSDEIEPLTQLKPNGLNGGRMSTFATFNKEPDLRLKQEKICQLNGYNDNYLSNVQTTQAPSTSVTPTTIVSINSLNNIPNHLQSNITLSQNTNSLSNGNVRITENPQVMIRKFLFLVI